jgi:hypothetical protein
MPLQQGYQQGVPTLFKYFSKGTHMPIAYNPTTVDGRSVADKNEIDVLKAVRYFGHLRRTEVARAVWPRSSHRSAYLMAHRTVKRMLKKGYLLERANTLGGISLVLASRGVARLRECDISAVEGYDMSSISGPQFFHRTVGTCFLIDRSRNDEMVFGEYAINRNWSPLSVDVLKRHYQKIPDGVTVAEGSARGYAPGFRALDWVEVESAFKPEAELQKIIRIGLRLPEPVPDTKNLVLDQVVFVYDTRQGHEPRILRTLRAYLREHPEANDPERLSHIVFARAHIDVPMQWHGVSEHTAWELLNGVQMDDQLENSHHYGDPHGITENEPAPEPSDDHDPDLEAYLREHVQESPATWGTLRPAGSGQESKPNKRG